VVPIDRRVRGRRARRHASEPRSAPPETVSPYDLLVARGWRGVFERLLIWFLASVAAAIVPFAFTFLAQWFRGGESPGVVSLFGRGELLLVAVVLSAAGAADAFFAGGRVSRSLRSLSGFAASTVALVAAGAFGSTTSNLLAGTDYSAKRVAWTSVVMLILSILTAGSCVVVRASAEETP
jgi:hypothetical protein